MPVARVDKGYARFFKDEGSVYEVDRYRIAV